MWNGFLHNIGELSTHLSKIPVILLVLLSDGIFGREQAVAESMGRQGLVGKSGDSGEEIRM
jgi:hypothetical protein